MQASMERGSNRNGRFGVEENQAAGPELAVGRRLPTAAALLDSPVLGETELGLHPFTDCFVPRLDPNCHACGHYRMRHVQPLSSNPLRLPLPAPTPVWTTAVLSTRDLQQFWHGDPLLRVAIDDEDLE
ncbi:MAG: hypothetical protein WKF57_05810 [Nakamurella sp.]